MTIAALYDIHGNLPALEAVLHEVRALHVDVIVVGGDVIPGPMPGECLDRLFDLDIPVRFILGNGEIAVLDVLYGSSLTNLPEYVLEDIQWAADRLLPGHLEHLTQWPATLKLEVDDAGCILFCHAIPGSADAIITMETPEETLMPIFDLPDISLVVCGHTHMQFDRRIGNTRVINAGSVGMPYGEHGAYWLILKPGVELRCTPYDYVQANDRIRATAYPHASHFAEHHVLNPPAEQEMLDLFRRTELS